MGSIFVPVCHGGAKILPTGPCWGLFLCQSNTKHFRNDKGTDAEMFPAIVSGMVTGDALVSYWSIFSLVLFDSPRSLCES